MPRRSIPVLSIFLTAGALLAVLPPSGFPDSGQRKDGIPVVENAEPRYWDGFVSFEHLYDIDITDISLFGKKTMADCDTKIAFDRNGNLYLLDEYECQISVFDKRGKSLREFGRSGQGPQEFVMPSAIFIKNERIYVLYGRMGGEYKVLGLDGTYISNQTNSVENRLRIYPVKSGYVILRGVTEPTFTKLDFVLTSADEAMAGRKDLFRILYPPGFKGPYFEFIWHKWFLILDEGSFFYPEDNFGKYSITKYDREGNPEFKLQRPYKISPYSPAARERFNSLYREGVEKKTTACPESPPVVINMFQDDRGHVWVISGETSEDSLDPEFLNTVDIFDRKGKWISSLRSQVVSKNSVFNAGKIYRVRPADISTDVQWIEVYAIKYLK